MNASHDVAQGTSAPACRATQPIRLQARLYHGLDAAGEAWRRIEAAGHCTAFQRFDWVETIAAHLEEAGRTDIFVVEVFDEETGGPLLLLPLVRQKARGHTTLVMPGAEICDYCAPLVAPNEQWTPATASAAWRAVRAVLPRADALRLDRMPKLVSGAVNPFMLLRNVRDSQTTTCGIAIDGDPDTVLERCCDPRFVKKLGKTGRRLAQRGTVRFVEAQTEAQVHDLFDTLLRQRLSRFDELGRVDLLRRKHVADFYRAAALAGLSGGAVRLLGLRVGDEWVGTYYGLRHDGVFQGLIVTIAGDAWKTCSPGLHVHAHVIRWARAAGLRYFDMSVGPAAYKDQIGGQRSALYTMDHALSLRGAAILSAVHALADVKASFRKHRRSFAAARTLFRKLRPPRQPG